MMRIVGHISYFSLRAAECDSGSFEGKEAAVLHGYGSLNLEEITAQKCLFGSSFDILKISVRLVVNILIADIKYILAGLDSKKKSK